MNLADLRIFVGVARCATLGAAALELHLTPSAVSKALRRLEESLGAPLFDRSAKLLALNDSGRRLLGRAQTLLALAEQARDDIMGERAALECKLGGPSILLWRHGAGISAALAAYPAASVRLLPVFEDDAMAALARGDIHGAIVTSEALRGRGEQWEATPLGSLALHLVAHRKHPLARKRVVRAADVLAHDFACPTRSLLCGVQRGVRSDGWRADAPARRIRYWTDDLHLLLGFVRSGAALAYLPEVALQDPELVRIELADSELQCDEQVWLVWQRANASEWQHRLAAALAHQHSAGARPDIWTRTEQ